MSSSEQGMKLLKELKEIFPQFYMILIGFMAAMNPDSETSLMIALLVVIVLYFLVLVLGTVLQVQLHIRNFLPIFTVILLVQGSAVSVLALSIISSTIAWMTLGLCVGFLAFLVYYHLIPTCCPLPCASVP
ncbi:hypothetical protein L6164_036760 [Bauhinia variegata]|uniref:Uncharacterized protein n=1 Tax=Bauhinia variegata TaxID=167791 RepID=A0ACB9KI82_BAUVA|nr:hypothetical protein L6164_036760 [Bauhinia variegata]